MARGGVIFEMHDAFEDIVAERTIDSFSSAHMLEVNVLDVFPSFPWTTETEEPGLKRQTQVAETEDALGVQAGSRWRRRFRQIHVAWPLNEAPVATGRRPLPSRLLHSAKIHQRIDCANTEVEACFVSEPCRCLAEEVGDLSPFLQLVLYHFGFPVLPV